ncbi:MAG: hypothetical protein SVX43_05345 [Cyanobacteriota bacterium]|nr:hypothetical protein [Cyanobacteriota bacterium]
MLDNLAIALLPSLGTDAVATFNGRKDTLRATLPGARASGRKFVGTPALQLN